MQVPEATHALVVGGGPAGLMAAETLAAAGRCVVLAEARPTLGRKLLMAGKSGLNLTKDEPGAAFAPPPPLPPPFPPTGPPASGSRSSPAAPGGSSPRS